MSLPGAEDITVASVGITEMPPTLPPRITANLTPPRRRVGKLMAEAGKLMVAENTASQ